MVVLWIAYPTREWAPWRQDKDLTHVCVLDMQHCDIQEWSAQLKADTVVEYSSTGSRAQGIQPSVLQWTLRMQLRPSFLMETYRGFCSPLSTAFTEHVLPCDDWGSVALWESTGQAQRRFEVKSRLCHWNTRISDKSSHLSDPQDLSPFQHLCSCVPGP